MRPLRVMHVLDRLALAGTELGVIRVVKRLDRRRYTPMICCLRDALPDAMGELGPGIPVFTLDRKEGLDLRLAWSIARICRREGVEILHSHNWSTRVYTALGRELARVPILVHGEHGRETDRPDLRLRRRLTERLLAMRADHFTAVSRDIAQHIHEAWGVAERRIAYIPNGVDLDRFGTGDGREQARHDLGIDSGDCVLCAVGGFRAVKDHATLVAAFARVLAAEPRALLLLIGLDPEGRFLARMEAANPDWPRIRGRVRFLGPRRDVERHLQAADVYVNSSWYEGMSNTTLEAMASRLPIVATAVGGTPDLVTPGENGWLVPARDPKALAEALLEALSDPARARLMGLRGRERIERRHSYAAMVRGNTEVYDRIATRKLTRTEPSARIKVATARTLDALGIVGLIERGSPRALTVIGYHRVLSVSERLWCALTAMSVTTDSFERQIALIAARRRVLSEEEVLAHLEERRPFPRGAVWITFDDGYADNYANAFPILKRYGVPATFFVTTGPIDTGGQLWWDEVEHAVTVLGPALLAGPNAPLEARSPRLRQAFASAGRLRGDAAAMTRLLVRALNTAPPLERRQVIEAITSRARDVDPSAPPRAIMTWDEVRALGSAGMTIGAHTKNHAYLTELTHYEARREVLGSMSRIEEETGVRPASFAYPSGRSSEKARDVVASCGLRLALTTRPGRNRAGSDPLLLRRRDAGYFAIGPRVITPHALLVLEGAWDWANPDAGPS